MTRIHMIALCFYRRSVRLQVIPANRSRETGWADLHSRHSQPWQSSLTFEKQLKSCAMENKSFNRHLSLRHGAIPPYADCADFRRWQNTNLRALRQSADGVLGRHKNSWFPGSITVD